MSCRSKPINLDDQAQIVSLLLEVAARAQARRDGDSLYALSKVASVLLPYAADDEVTFFFDLGEYIYECAVHIERTDSGVGEWESQLREKLRMSQEVADGLLAAQKLD